MNSLTFASTDVPFALHSEGPAAPTRPAVVDSGLVLTAGPRSDLFLDPRGTASPPDAERFVAEVHGDFQWSARVSVDYREVFDSAVLICYQDPYNWLKICAELDPERRSRVVTVVTRCGASDDANGWDIDGAVYLRVARMGPAIALHASSDGVAWRLARYCAFGEVGRPLAIGILAQSPLGKGMTARFTQVRFTRRSLEDVRDGT